MGLHLTLYCSVVVGNIISVFLMSVIKLHCGFYKCARDTVNLINKRLHLVRL